MCVAGANLGADGRFFAGGSQPKSRLCLKPPTINKEWHGHDRRVAAVVRPNRRGGIVASVKQVVDATSDAGRAAASAMIGIGDGIAGGVVGGVSGAVYGAAEGLGIRRPTAPTAVLAVAAVGAGVLGLVDWPLLALAGGAALVASQLRGGPQGSFTSPVPAPASTRPRKNAATTSTPTPPTKTAPVKPATVKRAPVTKAAEKTPAEKTAARKAVNGRAAASGSANGRAAAGAGPARMAS